MPYTKQPPTTPDPQTPTSITKYFYTTPREASVQLALDSGVTITGSGPVSANGRDDAHALEIPGGTPSQGAVLKVACPGYRPSENRGIWDMSNPAAPIFNLDDVRLTPESVAPGPTPPDPGPTPGPPSNDPEAIIHEVYATGKYDLSEHDGCGQFTAECCTQLHERNNAMWGHFKKNPGQNQYDGHAVDAVQCLVGEYEGGWDIIHDSVSPSATPAFNRVGPSDPSIWYYEEPVSEMVLTVQSKDRYWRR